MFGLNTIVDHNDKAQAAHVIAAFSAAKRTNRDGFTLDFQGNLVERTDGYAVGVQSVSHVETLVTHAVNNPKRYENHALGFWRDADDGREYVDLVSIELDRERALKLAAAHGQKAVWHFANACEIYTN